MISLLYMMYTIPTSNGINGIGALPWENKAMAGMFVRLLIDQSFNPSSLTLLQITHYLYRAVLAPILNPSMSPIHIIVWFFAIVFQVINGISIGGWLGGYGPKIRMDWTPEMNYKAGGRMELGMMIWALGFIGNIFHDDELREIRRAALRSQKARAAQQDEKDKGDKGVGKVYMIPQNGLFEFILYPHYFCEWIEWAGFWLMAGTGCVPARNFVLNEIATMLPRALQGKKWYVERFGKEKVGGKKAVIPWLL